MQTASSVGLSGRSQKTTKARIQGVLKSDEVVDANVTTTGTMTNPQEKMAFTVYDSLGNQHTLNFGFSKVAETLAVPANGATPATPGTQTWAVTVQPSPDVTSYDAVYSSTSAGGAGNAPGLQIVFDENGNPLTINGTNNASPANNAPPLTINWNSSAAASVVSLDFGNIGERNGLRVVGSQYDVSQPVVVDGHGPGKYKNTTFTQDGYLVANFDNGDPAYYGKIALAMFPAQDNLLEQTGGVYLPTPESGSYSLHFTNQGGTGSISPGTYEESTIDTTEEFTALIVDQQLYTANLKGISAIDDMLKALAQLGR